MPEKNVHTLFYRDLGKLIREARISKEISQDNLAKKVNLSRVSIVNIEQGIQKIQIHALIQIAITLELSLEELKPLILNSQNEGGLDKSYQNRIEKSEIDNLSTLRKNLLDIKKNL